MNHFQKAILLQLICAKLVAGSIIRRERMIKAQIKQITDRLEGIKCVSNNIIQHNSDSKYDFFNEVWFETPQAQEKAILTFSNTKLFTNVLKISPCYTQFSER